MLTYCLHPEHTEKGTRAWFLSPQPAKFCPSHSPTQKPRLRIMDGQWHAVRDGVAVQLLEGPSSPPERASSPALPILPTPEDVVRFWSYVETGDLEECWLWRAGKATDGYGSFSMGGKPYPASRVAYMLAHGPIPDGLIVRHRCDNPPCCNPRHLLTGTHRDNAMDRAIRGRTNNGRGVHTAQLTEADVMRIRNAPRSQWAAIAYELGRPYVTVYSAAIGRSWKHLPGAVREAGTEKRGPRSYLPCDQAEDGRHKWADGPRGALQICLLCKRPRFATFVRRAP